MLERLSTPSVWAAFAGAAAVIAVSGALLSRVCDRLADQTGLGEALFGAVLLGAVTSLSGLVTSVAAAADGLAQLAVSNALGGIAAQTAFLGIADFSYRRANLEHAAASAPNLVQGALLIVLLAIPLIASAGPNIAIFGIHPASLLMAAMYVLGVKLAQSARQQPMWGPTKTRETRLDIPQAPRASFYAASRPWLFFLLLAALTGGCGYLVSRLAAQIVMRTRLSESVVGGLFTAISTSLPELVTTLAAVRAGALTLAVAGIIGGNSFDVLFLALSDAAYREGSIYHNIGPQQTLLTALTILMTGILLLGLLGREKHGVANIGFESMLMLLIYLGGIALVVIMA